MKTEIKVNSGSKSLPCVGECWTHNPDDKDAAIMLRIPDDYGRRAVALSLKSNEDMIFSVNLKSGFVSYTYTDGFTGTILQPKGGVLEFEPES